MASDDDDKLTFDPKRRLCPDDACIGVLDHDGKCPVCGLVGQPGQGPISESEAQPAYADEDPSEGAPVAAEPISPSGFDPARRLCSDDTCIGVIGPEGRCTECGARG
jgi:hypothetical protein